VSVLEGRDALGNGRTVACTPTAAWLAITFYFPLLARLAPSEKPVRLVFRHTFVIDMQGPNRAITHETDIGRRLLRDPSSSIASPALSSPLQAP
jgi:hypothetical protein